MMGLKNVSKVVIFVAMGLLLSANNAYAENPVLWLAEDVAENIVEDAAWDAILNQKPWKSHNIDTDEIIEYIKQEVPYDTAKDITRTFIENGTGNSLFSNTTGNLIINTVGEFANDKPVTEKVKNISVNTAKNTVANYAGNIAKEVFINKKGLATTATKTGRAIIADGAQIVTEGAKIINTVRNSASVVEAGSALVSSAGTALTSAATSAVTTVTTAATTVGTAVTTAASTAAATVGTVATSVGTAAVAAAPVVLPVVAVGALIWWICD